MSFPKIHFGDINQYATKIEETNANKKVFIFIDENTQNWLSHIQVSTFKTAFVSFAFLLIIIKVFFKLINK